MKFTKPDQKTVARMTVMSLSALLDTLKKQRATVVEPLDVQIDFYEKLLEQKKNEGQQNAKATSRV